MNYEVGKQYEMKVVDIRKDSAGYNYIALHDDDPNKEYRVYNILKCQYESLPDTLYVMVKSIDVFGKIKFVQDEARLNREHYQEGKYYAFQVTDVKEVSIRNQPSMYWKMTSQHIGCSLKVTRNTRLAILASLKWLDSTKRVTLN